MNLKKITKSAVLPVFFLINLLASASTAFAGDPPAGSAAGGGAAGAGAGGAPAAPAAGPSTSSFPVGTYLQTKAQQDAKNPIEIAPYIIRLINFLATLIGSCAFLAIIIGGIMLLTSAGKEAQVTKGKDIIKYAIIGLAVSMAAYFITAFVQSIFYEYGT